MRPFRHAVSSFAILILATGALGACSSSSGKPNDGGTGGSTGSDAGADAPKDTPASTDAPKDMPASTDTQVSDVGFDYGFADGPTSPANITLTIPALAGGTFPPENTCAGVNTSPAMSWTAGPAGTMSYAVTLTDTSFMNAAHWVIWDIPATVTSLPAALPSGAVLTNPAGAKQLHKIEFFGSGSDYRGPCPMGATHTYVFEVTAVPTATLTLGPAPHTEDIRTELQNVGIGHGDVSATSNASPPPADAGGQ
jgi:Raf kinase inhibitor-like YbhB/YbcL family protein